MQNIFNKICALIKTPDGFDRLCDLLKRRRWFNKFNYKAYSKQYYQEHKEKKKEYRKLYYKLNKETCLLYSKVYSKRYYQEYKEKIKEQKRKYYLKKKEEQTK